MSAPASTPLASRLYAARVMHQRLGPVRHRLRYRLFCMLIDLDETAALATRMRLFSAERFNLVSFHERDHGDRGASRLRDWVAATLAQAELPPPAHVRLLCMPRVLGAAFNPLSIYFCHATDGTLASLIYEVRNTFGERHLYVMRAGAGDLLVQDCAKRFHVSPFQPMAQSYRFRLRVPAERLAIAIETRGPAGPALEATWHGRSLPPTDASLLGCLLRLPLLPFAILPAIHWQALKLFLKGARFHRKPAPPHDALTVGSIVP